MKLLIILITTQFLLVQMICAQSELWGVSSAGGGDNIGTIFSTDGEGNNFTKEFSWAPEVSGNSPTASFTEGLDGRLYGVTFGGGLYGVGVLFEYDPEYQTYIKRFQFDGPVNGAQPYGNLVLASNGKLYGVTLRGGTDDKGTLFEYDPVERALTTKVHFTAENGSSAFGGLVESANGKFYGLTSEGGANEFGVLYEYNSATDTYTKLIDFDDGSLGGSPTGRLVEGNSNMLYAMTSSGGDYDQGVIFKFDAQTNELTKTYDFGLEETEGVEPFANFTKATNGKLYAMTSKGGANMKGVLFEYDMSDDSYSKKIDFDGLNGGEPFSSMVSGDADVLYGLSTRGGVHSSGTLFEYNTTDHALTKKVDFRSTTIGSLPYNEMILKDGIYYGMTSSGGSQNSGVIFQYDPNTFTYTVNLEFESNIDGDRPYGSLFEASDGLLYGLTKNGGKYNKGTLYQFDPVTNKIKVKVDFLYAMGTFPENGLIEPVPGKLYGTAIGGGQFSGGTLFEYDIITEEFVVKASFSNSVTGANPFGKLLKAANGQLYGMTYSGGSEDLGAIFQYNLTTEVLTKKIDFDGTIKGSNPRSGFIEVNGHLYGLTSKGGDNDEGVLFEYTTSTNAFVKKIDFSNELTGKSPFGGLTIGTDTELFGTTFEGGTVNKGVIFKFDYSDDSFTRVIDFDGEMKGESPIGPMSLNANGKFYGVCNSGGLYGYGVIYELDPSDNSFVKTHDFTLQEGRLARSGLIEICRKPAYTVPSVLVYDVCAGQSLTIDLMSNNTDTYEWGKDNSPYPGFTGGILEIALIELTDDGVYEVEMTNVCGLTESVSLTINVTDDLVPNVTISVSKTDLCKGEQVSLMGQGATSYQWNEEVLDGQSFTPLPTKTYTVIGTADNLCSASASIEIPVNELPVVTASVDKMAVCQTEEIILSGEGAESYSWSHGVIDRVAYQLPTSTVFTLEGTGVNGCKSSVQIDVTTYLLPNITAIADFEELCQNEMVTLSVSGTAASLVWNKNVVSDVPFALTESGDYTVSATSTENCISISTISLVAFDLPVVVVATQEITICRDEEVTLLGFGADTYVWDNGVFDNVAFTVAENTEFIVIGTENVNGCQQTASVTVNVGDCTGLEDLDNSAISIYPNPFTEEIIIENNNEKINSLVIYSIDGEPVKAILSVDEFVTHIDMNELPIGTYFIQVNTNTTSYQTKMIKK